MIFGITHRLAGVGPGDYWETIATKIGTNASDMDIKHVYTQDYVIDTEQCVFLKNKDGAKNTSIVNSAKYKKANELCDAVGDILSTPVGNHDEIMRKVLALCAPFDAWKNAK